MMFALFEYLVWKKKNVDGKLRQFSKWKESVRLAKFLFTNSVTPVR
jgi:hypothetical protein